MSKASATELMNAIENFFDASNLLQGPRKNDWEEPDYQVYLKNIEGDDNQGRFQLYPSDSSAKEVAQYLEQKFNIKLNVEDTANPHDRNKKYSNITIDVSQQTDVEKSLQKLRDETQKLQIDALDAYFAKIPADIAHILGDKNPDRITREAISAKFNAYATKFSKEGVSIDEPDNVTVAHEHQRSLQENISAYKS